VVWFAMGPKAEILAQRYTLRIEQKDLTTIFHAEKRIMVKVCKN
jgi:hypothetical protein